MIESLTVEEQFAAIESMATPFTSSATEVDQFGFETKPLVTSESQGIVASILGHNRRAGSSRDSALLWPPCPLVIQVAYGAESVRNNPAPHVHTEQFREVFKSSSTTQDGFQRMKVENIPLPGEKEVRSTPDLPWLTPTHEFQSSGVAQIPLPGTAQPVPERAPLEEKTPGMPDLDDLFAEPSQSKVPEPVLPTLPNLDDLF